MTDRDISAVMGHRRCPHCGDDITDQLDASYERGYQQGYDKRDPDRADNAEAEIKRLRAALVRCATVSGADVSDGVPTWPSVGEWAVREVQQLRDDYDDPDNAR